MVRIPRRIEINLGDVPFVEVKEQYDFDFTQLLNDQLQPIFKSSASIAQFETHAEAPNSAAEIEAGGLPWWLALHVRRWPVDTGQSSAIIGNRYIFDDRVIGKTMEFSGARPPGIDLFYMEEIEHTGKDSLQPLFLLEEKIIATLSERLRRDSGLITRTLRSV